MSEFTNRGALLEALAEEMSSILLSWKYTVENSKASVLRFLDTCTDEELEELCDAHMIQ